MPKSKASTFRDVCGTMDWVFDGVGLCYSLTGVGAYMLDFKVIVVALT